jgi:RimJ/RimL family protein N-acetyltransferase
MQNTSVWPYPLSFAHTTFMLKKAWLEPEGTFVFFPVLNGQITGSVGLHRRGSSAEYTLGYMLGQRFWGQGLASEAVASICRFGFRQLRAQMIHAEVAADNPASGRVLLKNSFEELPARRPGFSRARGAVTELRVFRLPHERLAG